MSGRRIPQPCAGVVCLRDGQVLLIRRGTAPRLGQWSIPGGRIEWGETAAAAALRELQEETGVQAELLGLLDVVDYVSGAADGEDTDRHNVLIDYAARWVSGEPAAEDDASEARFWPLAEALDQVGWAETRRIIALAYARYG